jgi:hypothetical protein
MPEQQNEDAVEKSAESANAISDYFDGVRQLELQGYESGVKRARTVLFVTAALVFVGELIYAASNNITMTPTLIGIVALESVFFVGLALWTRRKPYTAIMIGLIVFIGLWVLAIISSGFKAAIGGILVRIIIIAYLIKALKPAKDWEEAKRSQ